MSRGIRIAPILVTLAAISTACDRRAQYTAHFVVPLGFRGAIQMVPESPDGILPQVSANTEVYVIPDDGVLRLQGPGPFVVWQSMSAEFADGSTLPTEMDLTPAPDGSVRVRGTEDTIAIWTLCTDTKGRSWMYVGTRREAMNAASMGSGHLTPAARVPDTRTQRR
jgi:hypothetical protein